jgi:hypothetical protein
MSLEKLTVQPCEIEIVRNFVEKHHYSRSIRGVTPSFSFEILLDGSLVGAAIFGRPAMKQTFDKYSDGGKYTLLELRRLCLVDDTPRNIESKSLGIMLRALKRHGIDRVLSYADPNHGHVGTIYRATGFEFLGQTRSIPSIWYRDRRYHQRCIDEYRKWSTRSLRRYANYKDKSLGLFPFALELRQALLDGSAVRKVEAGKFIYLKTLREAA